jgi:hypothetical protein
VYCFCRLLAKCVRVNFSDLSGPKKRRNAPLCALGNFHLEENKEDIGRGGGDRIYQGAESKRTLRNVL